MKTHSKYQTNYQENFEEDVTTTQKILDIRKWKVYFVKLAFK